MTDDQQNTAAPAHRRSALRRWAWHMPVYGSLLLAMAALVAAAPFSARGTVWLLSCVPHLTVQQPQGALLKAFRAQRVTWTSSDGAQWVVQGLAWEAARAQHSDAAAWGWAVVWPSVRAAEVRWVAASRSAASATTPPTSLALPVGVTLESVQIDALHWGVGPDAREITHLRARVQLQTGSHDHAMHVVEVQEAHWQRWQARVRAQIQTASPMPLQAQLALAQDSAPQSAAADPLPACALETSASAVTAPVGASAMLSGTLRQWEVRAQMHLHDQCALAQAQLRPFAGQPVEQLTVSARHFDLAALDIRSPHTSLTGHAQLRPEAFEPRAATPAKVAAGWRVDVEATNAAAGLWSQARVPLRELHVSASVARDGWQRGRLERLDMDWGTEEEDAGHVSGQGVWSLPQAHAAGAAQASAPPLAVSSVQLRLEQIKLQRLEPSAPAWILDGQAQLQSATPRGGSHAPSSPSMVDVLPLDLRAQLQARVEEASHATGPVAATLSVHARGQAGQIDLEQCHVTQRAPDASPQPQGDLQAQLRWSAQGVQIQAQGALQNIDPWAWADNAAQTGGFTPPGPSRLNARLSVDLRRASTTNASAPQPPWWSTLVGGVRVQLLPSQLAGSPLQGSVALQAAPSQAAVLNAELHAGDNQVVLKARLDRAAQAQDEGSVSLDAPRLETLAPLLTLVHAPVLSGHAQARANVQGRWPRLSVRGGADLGDIVRAEPAASGVDHPAGPGQRLHHLVAHWDVDPLGSGRMQLHLEAQGVSLAQGTGADEVHIDMEGSAGDHRWQVDARTRTPALRVGHPPAPNAQGEPADAGIAGALHAQGHGSWVEADEGDRLSVEEHVDALLWKAAGSGLTLASTSASPPASGPASPPTSPPTSSPASATRSTSLGAPPLDAASVGAHATAIWLEVQSFTLDYAAQPAGRHLTISPVQAHLLGASLTLHQFQWHESAGQPAQLDLEAELEPLAVAPLLARWQPQAGWGGDLTVVGHAVVHSRAQGKNLEANVELARRGGDLTLTDSAIEGAAVMRLGMSELALTARAHAGVWTLEQRVSGRLLGQAEGHEELRDIDGSIWPSASSPLSGTLSFNIANLRPWGTWVPPGWRLSGQMQAQAQVSGTLGAPSYEGRVTGRQLGASNLLQGVNVSDGDLSVTLNRDEAKIERFVLRATPGELRISGGATFGERPQAHLHVDATHFGLLQRVDRLAIVSGSAHVDLAADEMRVLGQLSLDRGLVDITHSESPSLSDDVQVDRPGDASSDDGDGGPGAGVSGQRKIALDLSLDLGDTSTPALRVTGRGLNARLGGHLRLTNSTGTNAAGSVANVPKLVGRVFTVDGEYAAYGQQLAIQKGSVSFDGPIDNPRLNILALRKQSATEDEDVKVGVAITGTAQDPRVRLYSEPDMTDTEKLSWLVLGHGSGGLGGSDMALLQSAATALLAGENSSRSPFQSMGLDELSVRQDDTTVHQTIVSVGKQVSKRWYVGYERSLSATAGTWQLIYRWAQHFTIRALS